MARKYGLGLYTLKMGAIAGDGGMSTSLTAISDIVPGTAEIITEDGTTTDFNIEEEDDPVISSTTPGAKRLNFSSSNISSDNLLKLFGGVRTAYSAGPPVVQERWDFPSTKVEFEASFEGTDKRGNVYQIPRAKVVANLNLSLDKTKLAQVNVSATILVPTKANTPSLSILYPNP